MVRALALADPAAVSRERRVIDDDSRTVETRIRTPVVCARPELETRGSKVFFRSANGERARRD